MLRSRARLTSATFSVALTAVAVLGSLHGTQMTEKNAADLNARETVSALIAQNDIAVQYAAAAQARATAEGFVPTLDAADALVASSDGKASAEARVALADIVAEFKTTTGALFADAIEYREVIDQSVATATVALTSASATVTAEVAAWQAAEDARIAAEAEAAAQAARDAERSYGNGGGGNSGGNSGGGSNGNGGGGNSGGGGGDRAEAWRQIAAGQGVTCFSVIPGSVSYYSSGCIQIGQNPLDANAERVLWHEIAHHHTAGKHSYTVACTRLARELGGDVEVWAQAWTQVNLGWSMPQYASASQAFIDGMRNAGCGI